MENGKIIESAASMCLSMKPSSYLILQTSYRHHINIIVGSQEHHFVLFKYASILAGSYFNDLIIVFSLWCIFGWDALSFLG